MDLFRYLMVKNGHNYLKDDDLFSYKLAKGQGGTYAIFTGTTINATNTRRGKMKVNLLGNTSQYSTTGEQLLVFPYYEAQGEFTRNGVKFTQNSDGSVTIDGRASSTTNFSFRQNNAYIPNGDYSAKLFGATYSQCRLITGGSSSGVTYDDGVFKTFTVTNNDCGYFLAQIPQDVTINNLTVYPMLVSGTYTNSTMPEFEKYTGGTPSPNPSYPQDVHIVSGDNTIVSTGKNLFDLDRTLGTPSDTAGGNTTKRTFDISTFVKGLSVNNYYNTGITIDYTFIDNGIKITTNQGGYALAFPVLLKPNTTYTISANISPIGAERLRTGYYQQDGTFISFEINYSSNNYFSFTTPANAYYTLVHLTPSVNTEVTFTNIMLNEGSTALPYEPYTSTSYPIHLGEHWLGWIGDYKDRFIKTTGKNLFDKDNVVKVENKILNDSGTEINDAGGAYTKTYMPVKPSTTYVTSGMPNGGTDRIYFFDNAKTFISRTSGYTNLSTFTFTTPSNCYYVDVQYYMGNNNFNLWQIEEGSIATSYEPYGTNEWYLEKKIGKVVLDGSEAWESAGTSSITARFYYDLATMKNVTGCYCDKFTYINAIAASNTNEGFSCSTYQTNFYINILQSRLDTIDTTGLKSWLSTHNTTAYYVLATPTYTLITGTLKDELNALQGARSYDEQTNISQVNNDLSANLEARILVNE